MKTLRALGGFCGVVVIGLGGCERDASRVPGATARPSQGAVATTPAPDRTADPKQTDYVAASRALAATLEAQAGTAAQYSELAWLAYLAGDFAMAENAIAKGLALAPSPKLRSSLYLTRGRVAQAAGRLPEAAAALGEAIAADDNPAAQYWQAALPTDGAVVSGDAKAVCAALVALTAMAYDVESSQVACELAEAAVTFPKVETAALAGKVAVLGFAAEGTANQLVYALWQQGEIFAVRGAISQTLGDSLHRGLRRVERLGEHLVLHTEVKGNSRAASYLATEVEFCPAGARPCSLRLRTGFEEYLEGKEDDAAAVAWTVAYEVGPSGLLRVTQQAGTPPVGVVGEHRIY